MRHRDQEGATMKDMKVTASGYDFRPAQAAMQRYIDGNLLSGLSSAILVGRDLVDVTCIGWADKEAQIPLRVDHIFRVFSNTKLITSCAALLLFEEGHFQLDDPIEQFIPQLANRRVVRPDATSLDQTEPAVRPITIRHLMSHSSGLSYGVLDPGTMIFNAYNQRKVLSPATTLAEMIDVLADLPLVFHPGTSWEYSVATDVMARLLTDPMKPGLTRTDDAPYPGAYLRPFPRLNGGGGLVSTLPDMVALIRSLLPGSPTLLKPNTISLMMTNQLPKGMWIRFPALGELVGRGFGLGSGLIVEPSALDGEDEKGQLFWGGVAGTQWWISPKMNMAGIVMAQRQMAFAHPFAFEFKRLANEAVKRKS
jgi:CubicO group peptidase (beta-lactamase class C family)